MRVLPTGRSPVYAMMGKVNYSYIVGLVSPKSHGMRRLSTRQVKGTPCIGVAAGRISGEIEGTTMNDTWVSTFDIVVFGPASFREIGGKAIP